MGQQQLLLLVLGIVIVGIAIVVGVNAFSENSSRTNSDALIQNALRIASAAQAWKQKPELLGGSPDQTKRAAGDYSELTSYSLGFVYENVVDEDCYKNQVGEFALFAEEEGLGILATNVAHRNVVGVTVTGSLDSDIALYIADWNPVKNGATPNGEPVDVRSHQRCRGRAGTPMILSGR